ncbi:MAG: divalent-cation tolerance protein CutA [bacterium]
MKKKSFLKKAQPIVVFVTCPSRSEALALKEMLLNERKAACINIIPAVHSFFWWKGKVDACREALLIIKTRSDVFKKVVSLVRSSHTYEVPEIIALPVIDGNKEYLDWMNETIKK